MINEKILQQNQPYVTMILASYNKFKKNYNKISKDEITIYSLYTKTIDTKELNNLQRYLAALAFLASKISFTQTTHENNL